MKIAIISDIHENWHNFFLALDKIKELDCKQILCLGDMMNTGIAIALNKFDIPTFAIWGNNDGDYVQILSKTLGKKGNLTMGKGSYDFFEIDGKKIFLSHYEDLAVPMAKSGEFDVICYGHTHQKYFEKIGNTIVINPGEIAAATKNKKATFALYDTTKNKVEFVELENAISLRTEYVQKKYDELGFQR